MVKITQNLVSSSKYSLKAPNEMTPKYITIHNTANDAPAKNEASYHNSNSNQVSFHYAVDDKEIVQVVPDNRNAWHCGDGKNGIGNRQSIGIEICYSKSGGTRYYKAEENAVELTAYLLKKYNIPIKNVKQHYDWSKKDCPHRIRKEGAWNKFLERVQKALDVLNGVKATNVLTAKQELYRIYSGTFLTRTEAENAKVKMAKNKLANEAYITIHEDNGKFYLVTGTYIDKITAEKYLSKMKELKILWVGTVQKS